MHTSDLTSWTHDHLFHAGNPMGEKNTWRVVALTATMMVVEISAGLLFNSMALLADGWHMSTHAAALCITGFAYALSRRHASDTRYAFGTWKIEVLGGFASAIVLGMVALYIAAEAAQRFFRPLDIHYDQALAVAVVGLLANLVSALLLKEDGTHHHDGEHAGHTHGRTDLNLLAAYTHVIADAMTSVLAIVALLGAKLFQWNWLDPAMGIVGATVVSVWAIGLLRDTSRVLLDREMDSATVARIRAALEADGDSRMSDLHVWRVGPQQFACVVSMVAGLPKTPEDYKALLAAEHEQLVHVTVEVCRCQGDSALPA